MRRWARTLLAFGAHGKKLEDHKAWRAGASPRGLGQQGGATNLLPEDCHEELHRETKHHLLVQRSQQRLLAAAARADAVGHGDLGGRGGRRRVRQSLHEGHQRAGCAPALATLGASPSEQVDYLRQLAVAELRRARPMRMVGAE